jgi:hypothetical protein
MTLLDTRQTGRDTPCLRLGFLPHTKTMSATIAVRPSELGLGGFAARVFGKGETIIQEEPLVRWNPLMNRAADAQTDRESNLGGLEDALAALAPSARAAYYKLSQLSPETLGSISEPGEEDNMAAMSIWMSNSFRIGDRANSAGGSEEQAVFERIARLNHCCRPNAEHAWDAASGTQCVRALRRIALGEQIFLSYIGDESRVLQLPREKRQSMLLDAFGFTCVCSRCERGDVEDDRQHDMLNAALQREAASNALW